MRDQLKDLMPRTPLRLLQIRNRNDNQDTDICSGSNDNHRNSRLLDMITGNDANRDSYMEVVTVV